MGMPVAFIFLAILCCSTILLCGALNRTTKLMWTQSPVVPLPMTVLVQLEGDPVLHSSSSDYHDALPMAQQILHSWGSRIQGLDFSFRHNLLVWSDTANRRIQVMHMDSAVLHAWTLFTGTSSEVNGIALDWVNMNVYWTDALYNWVLMTPARSPRVASSPSPPTAAGKPPDRLYRIVLQEDLDNPHGLAVYPQRNWLFLSDWGIRPRIERMDLLGGNREALVDSDVLTPQALALDVTRLCLFWVDNRKGTVETIRLRGPQWRRTIISKNVGYIFDMAFYKDHLFLTNQDTLELQIVGVPTEGTRRDKGGFPADEKKISIQDKPYGIIVFDKSLQPGYIGKCQKAECEHMCVELKKDRPQCLCGEGYDLMDDLRHCVQKKSFPIPSHLYSIGSAICTYPATVADMDMTGVSLSSQCTTISDGLGYEALAFHARRNTLFFSSSHMGAIFSMTMEAGATPVIIVSGTGEVEGLTVDWVAGLLLWTDSTKREIKASWMDGSYQATLVSQGLTKPRGITVHPRRGKMYWTDLGSGGVGSAVMSAYIDGSKKQRLNISFALHQPNHLIIDYNTDRLYVTDSELNRVIQYDLITHRSKVFLEIEGAQFYGISLYKDYVLWTDNADLNGIHIVRVDLKTKVRGIIHPGFGVAKDLITVDISQQPDMASRCKNSVARCDQLCLPRGEDSYSCGCGTGFTLKVDMLCTSGNLSTDNFLLVADANQRNIYQVDVSVSTATSSHREGALKAVTQGEWHQPMALAFLSGGHIFWSDNKAHVIRFKTWSMTWPVTFLDLPEDSKVEGLAVDPTHSLLYFTDTGRDVIGVLDIKYGETTRYAIIVDQGLTNPRDIVAFFNKETGVGKIYWTDWGPKASISEALMDGKKRKALLTLNNTAWLNGLTLDHKDGALYWTDAYSSSVGRYDLQSGTHAIVLRTERAHFYGLFLMGDVIYLTDWRRPFLLRMPKKGGLLEEFGQGKFNKLYGITGYNSSEQLPRIPGPCSNHSGLCPVFSLCLPTSLTSVTCACMLGFVEINGKCTRNASFVEPTTQSLDQQWHKQFAEKSKRVKAHTPKPRPQQQTVTDFIKATRPEGQSSWVVVVWVTGVLIFCTAVALGLLCYVKRLRRGQIPHSRLGSSSSSSSSAAGGSGAAAGAGGNAGGVGLDEEDEGEGEEDTDVMSGGRRRRGGGGGDAEDDDDVENPQSPCSRATAARVVLSSPQAQAQSQAQRQAQAARLPVSSTVSRLPSALQHLKVFYTRRPASQQVRIEEGFDNPSYNEAAMAMMASRYATTASSDDNQPSV